MFIITWSEHERPVDSVASVDQLLDELHLLFLDTEPTLAPKRAGGLRFILARPMRRQSHPLEAIALAGATAASLLVSSCSRPLPVSADQEPPAPVVEYVTHQEILTPLPLRVRLPARYGAESVVVLYQTWGSTDRPTTA
jgi:hypothetical protein